MNTATRFASASCLKADLPTTALLVLCVFASAAVGARPAHERLHATARRLCAQVADHLDLSHQPTFVACVDETLATALRKVTEIGVSTATAKGALWATHAYEVSP